MIRKKLEGRVRWFDNKTGDGFIRVGEQSIFVHWSAIAKGLKTRLRTPHKGKQKKVWCTLFKNQKVLVDIIEDSHYTQICKVY